MDLKSFGSNNGPAFVVMGCGRFVQLVKERDTPIKSESIFPLGSFNNP